MPDPILGAYTRHEKHDAADFANAEYSRHENGCRAVAHEHRPGSSERWTVDCSPHGRSDAEMADGGWSPVRECPNPDQHAIATLSRAFAAAAPCSCSAQRARAEKAEGLLAESQKAGRNARLSLVDEMNLRSKAEEERDEARADRNDALRREKAEQDRADKAKRERDAAVDSALFAAVPRPLTPDAITDEMVERALRSWRARSGAARVPDTVRDMLTAALTEPPARPEGAEEIEFLIADRLGGDVPGDVIRVLADEIAERAGATRLYPEDGAA